MVQQAGSSRSLWSREKSSANPCPEIFQMVTPCIMQAQETFLYMYQVINFITCLYETENLLPGHTKTVIVLT
jgi:hypothetical protein